VESLNLGKIYIPRTIEPLIKGQLFKGKVIVIYGARQVGKTTLVKKLVSELSKKTSTYLNCDEADIQSRLNEADTSTKLRSIAGDREIVVIDEAQRIKNIGLKLKLLIDTYPNQQFIATGSSSFELSDEISEPLTGRSLEYWLHPLSLVELYNAFGELELTRNLENIMIYGSYPNVVDVVSEQDKRAIINNIATNYLYKDVLKFGGLKSAEIIRSLLRALALQVGSEVSYSEIAQLIGVSKETVSNYIELLEKVYIIFRLNPLSRNLRKEIGKLRKIYFYDVGIRNALINNQNPLNMRSDVGALWENLMIAEKKKQENFIGNKLSLYFWRTYDQQEIDLVEEKGGGLWAYEFKWRKNKAKKPPKAWIDGYPNSAWDVITNENFNTSYVLPHT